MVASQWPVFLGLGILILAWFSSGVNVVSLVAVFEYSRGLFSLDSATPQHGWCPSLARLPHQLELSRWTQPALYMQHLPWHDSCCIWRGLSSLPWPLV